MTTVMVSNSEAKPDLFTLMTDWLNPEDGVYPFDSVYQEDVTPEEDREEGQVDMVTLAGRRHGGGARASSATRSRRPSRSPPSPRARRPTASSRSATSCSRSAARRSSPPSDVGKAVSSCAGRNADPVQGPSRREGRQDRRRSRSRPTMIDGFQRVGIRIGTGFEFPFDVSVNISADIGGPSAGLMFSLAIYDTLTPGSLTGDQTVAGTGTIDDRRQGRPDRRHPAEDRGRPRTTAPSCSWCRRRTVTRPLPPTTATCVW